VLREMMDFARTRTPERAPLDVSSVLEAGVRLASFDKAFKRLRVTTDFDPEAPPVSADADQLQQVFLNLLLNARDAMPEGGELSVRTCHDERAGEVVVEIADDGPGIPAEVRAHVFDPFYTTKPAGAGTGLGLAVCHRIVSAHGGRIDIRPNNGRGTSVRVALPVRGRGPASNGGPPEL
ncbi:MAG TPA: ATP-binding protein, partial [Pyrinomonadaceae bacterium]|nr:ATP-binding protein [Pyrinomonadaceae bacterium]